MKKTMVIALMAAAGSAAAVDSLKVADFGFDPEDSTRFLQKALDSGAREIVIGKMDTPWITLPLEVRSNTRIVLEKGVVVEAKRGAFLGRSDSLFTLRNVTNIVFSGYGATLRMHKADYVKPPYEKAEWRTALNLCTASDVLIEGIKTEDSGGDGVYLGVGSRGCPCRNVTIRDCDFAGSHRQGISVISVSGLLIENTILRDTCGTPPQSGIDFEPNSEDEVMENIVMRNCVAKNNAGRGFEIELARFTRASKPVSMLFEKLGMQLTQPDTTC